MTAATEKITYRTLDLWRRAMNTKATNRRNRKAARATRQHRGQRALYRGRKSLRGTGPNLLSGRGH